MILVGSWSPDQVEVWEAAVTFAFFPLMVVLSWAAERNFFREPAPDKQIELGRFKPGTYAEPAQECAGLEPSSVRGAR